MTLEERNKALVRITMSCGKAGTDKYMRYYHASQVANELLQFPDGMEKVKQYLQEQNLVLPAQIFRERYGKNC